MKLKLKEVIWEITNKCNNNCSYCGSKEALNKEEVKEETIIEIAKAIAEYPPEQIDLSGGDPLLVSLKCLKEVVEILKKAKSIVKVIVNPRSFKNSKSTESDKVLLSKLNLFDWIGLSINNRKELDIANEYFRGWKKVTVITNFSLENLHMYSKIEDFCIENKFKWQVQFTMFKDKSNLAIYEDQDAWEEFQSKLKVSMAQGDYIVLADNLNYGECSAGINSLGILFNGDIVPCLSYRSWKSLEEDVVGNVLRFPLKDIWEQKFKDQRFKDCKCCKDHCNRKCTGYKNIQSREITKDETIELINKICPPTKPIPPTKLDIMLYGVSPGLVQVYGVQYPSNDDFGGMMVYGAFENSSSTDYTVKLNDDCSIDLGPD